MYFNQCKLFVLMHTCCCKVALTASPPHVVGRRAARPCSVWVYRCLDCTPASGKVAACIRVLTVSEQVCARVMHLHVLHCRWTRACACVCVLMGECVCVFVSVRLNLYLCEAALGGGIIEVTYIISPSTALALTDESISVNCLNSIFINTSISAAQRRGPWGSRY